MKRITQKIMQEIMLLAALTGMLGGVAPARESPAPTWLDDYKIVWTTQSRNAVDSMPLGGGALGLNVWVENGELRFYIGSPDTHTEEGLLVKLGRIRLKTTPAAFASDFRQELDLANACLRLHGRTPSGAEVRLRLWVDALKPVVHVECAADEPLTVEATFESWPDPNPRYTVKPTLGGLEWNYRLNEKTYADHRREQIRQCGLEGAESQVADPGRNLTYGGRLTGDGLVPTGEGRGVYLKTPFRAWRVKTARPTRKLDLRVLTRVEQAPTLAAWEEGLAALERSTRATAPADYAATLRWWREFWDRSHIVLRPGLALPARERDPAWQVGRNYQLFRYMLACNTTGRFPTLFNGGFFNVDTPAADGEPLASDGVSLTPSPDDRLWASCFFMAQNQRLVYWPLLTTGDFDIMQPALRFYRDAAGTQRARAKKCWAIDGTPYPELIDWLGLFGWNFGTPGGHCKAEHLTYHYTSALDFAYMFLEYGRASGRDLRPCSRRSKASSPTTINIIAARTSGAPAGNSAPTASWSSIPPAPANTAPIAATTPTSSPASRPSPTACSSCPLKY